MEWDASMQSIGQWAVVMESVWLRKGLFDSVVSGVSSGGPSDALGIVTESEAVPLPYGVGMKRKGIVSGPSVVSRILVSARLIDEAGSKSPLDGWGDFNEIRFSFEKRKGDQGGVMCGKIQNCVCRLFSRGFGL
ncbi:hypothetical protein GOBAR_AA25333 [Gossypium barbadense]|uniref:Uncharacterized protein n=1 Tax=Gossypium barbadense TaxID=3634 RepID=A0A2P5WW66_GOSBA|nr:hypothetical protein GOBAR_AA25333 [Gossypium barbadense]